MSRRDGPRIVVCGAGIAGCAAAWQLAASGEAAEIRIVDERPPLSLTSDKSTECYRNWWPGPEPAMTALTNRSIDLMEALARESGDRFALSRRGYLFATASEETADALARDAAVSCALGAGDLRIHPRAGCAPEYRPAAAVGWEGEPTGADLIRDAALLREQFPWLTRAAVAALHVRRAGWLSAQQLGMLLLERARDAGARLVTGRVARVETASGRVRAVVVERGGASDRVEADVVVNAAGPYARALGRALDLELPVVCEGHVKVSFDDRLGAVPRDAPLMLWCDPVTLPFTPDERAALAEDPATRPLLEPFPAGVHGRPIGAGAQVVLYWTYDCVPRDEPVYPLPEDPLYAEIALRGMSVMVPALARYAQHLPRPHLDGGYYAKTPDNRPLVGPLGVDGAFALAALSGYGIMASPAAAELLAAHVLGLPLPPWAAALAPARFDDPGYASRCAAGTGQL